VGATLEDALVKSLDRRADPRHAVRVIAYAAGSMKRAGVADWAPDQQPRYEIDRVRSKDRDKKDRVRGLLEGLLK